jgi:plastocyanin
VAYVYVENVLAPAVKSQHKVIEQTGKKFMPGWAVIQRGTSIAFPNSDNIYHNVFSLSSGNSFDLGLYNSGGDAKSHTFNKPGAVDVYCNIHPQMAASVLVVPNKHFAKAKPDGSFEDKGSNPPLTGTYEIANNTMKLKFPDRVKTVSFIALTNAGTVLINGLWYQRQP